MILYMSDKISILSDDAIEQLVQKITSQTNYTREHAKEKLILFNYDYMRVIRDYMGLSEMKKETKVKSINQEIFRQIRTELDSSMKTYRDKNPINIDQIVENFNESDEREKNKISK